VFIASARCATAAAAEYERVEPEATLDGFLQEQALYSEADNVTWGEIKHKLVRYSLNPPLLVKIAWFRCPLPRAKAMEKPGKATPLQNTAEL